MPAAAGTFYAPDGGGKGALHSLPILPQTLVPLDPHAVSDLHGLHDCAEVADNGAGSPTATNHVGRVAEIVFFTM